MTFFHLDRRASNRLVLLSGVVMLQFLLMYGWSEFRSSVHKNIDLVEVEVALPPLDRVFKEVDLRSSSKEDWMQFGISEKVAQRTVKYLNSRRNNLRKEDLLNVYGFPKDLYTALKPFIKISDLPTNVKPKSKQITNPSDSQDQLRKANLTIKPKTHYTNKLPVVTGGFSSFELNTATQEDLMKIKGIGEVLSKRIIRFRSKLGGFYALDQLSEVYGLEEEVVNRVKESVRLNEEILQIPINSVDVFTLSQHPYIHQKEAEIIIAFRNQHGPFESLDELTKIEVLTEHFLKKITPYLIITH